MVCVAPLAPLKGGDVPVLAAARGGCSDELLLVEPLERGSDVAELVVTIDCSGDESHSSQPRFPTLLLPQ